MPPTITVEQIKGFSLRVLRAVMSGRGDEVLDLAKTNLLLNGVSGIERSRHLPVKTEHSPIECYGIFSVLYPKPPSPSSDYYHPDTAAAAREAG
jgi:hypothetical protein